jgi:hypothetical protein
VVFAIVSALFGALVAALRPRASLVVEILVLRQQLAVLKRARPRAPLRPIDRAFWVVVSRVWSRWADALAIVKPATVIGWHRRGFARFWAWKSKRVERPPLAPEVVALIVQMARENPLWSRRRVANELAKLGLDVSKDTVARYMPKPPAAPRRPPSTTWATFLRMHLAATIAIDFLVAPTVTFNVLYPWQNGYAEGWVGTLRRELLDHVVVLGERHLLHLVRQHAAYYNEDRPHMGLDGDAPVTRAVEPSELGKVVALPRVSGLHHRYVRRAA